MQWRKENLKINGAGKIGNHMQKNEARLQSDTIHKI